MDLDEEFIAAARPTRAHPPPRLPEPDWAAARDAANLYRNTIDLDQTDPQLRDALASLWGGEPGGYTRAERVVLLVLRRIYPHQTSSAAVMRAVAADVALAEAARILLESLPYILSSDGSLRQRQFFLHSQPDTRTWYVPPTPQLAEIEMLGRMACLASDDEYAELVSVVRTAAPQLPPVYRAAFALALPDSPELSHELITEFAGEDQPWVSWLQATATDPDLIEKARAVQTHRGVPVFADDVALVNALVVNRGSAAVPVLTPYAAHTTAAAALARIGLPDALRALAGVAGTSKDHQQLLRRAIKRWPAAAVAGLTQAVGDGGHNAAATRVLLVDLAARKPGLVAAVRPWLTGAAGTALDDVTQQLSADYDEASLDELPRVLTDPHHEDPAAFPAKLPKLPSFWNPRAWQRPMLHTGRVLPLVAVDHLGAMLAFHTGDGHYPGIADVKQACTSDSLAGFGWDMFTAWLNAGAPSKDSWAMRSLGPLGNDDTARRFTPLVRAWPGQAFRKRAVAGLDVLADIGSDVALMLLNGIAANLKFKALQDRARDKIDQIAAGRGLTTAQLEDRLVPDLGLDTNGTLLLNFGPRQFRVGFDERLKPFVRNLDGARLKELPKARRDDDAELAGAATARWKALKADARTVSGQQLLRLELAMGAHRRWDLADFEPFLARHPLVRHLVRRLMWAVYTEAGTVERCFRVAEDGQYTDADDEPVALPGDALIGLPHPLEISADDRTAFGQLFTDYELLQPFPQLDRDTYRLTDAERAATELNRWADLNIPVGKINGLTSRGWQRGAFIRELLKPLPDGWIAVAALSDGYATEIAHSYPKQITRLYIDTPDRRTPDRHTFGELDDITASELIRDLEALRG
ncbi:DUF4132 domain-containing protein [Mycobacterium talmoniae]|uniref:DUF4132 domain-containing protein n=1 Tax=Mycobacterium talmoniae TaxID=1858794 RepID=A0A1S1NCJ9_9MYCO|nr:DUF4132 domain-containing protein [Mycobacterium talmoniae]OHV03395.1 hypothetical protein BKN37_15220 [Mycobacterium talmoniae]PQM44971.1 hypothetical protein C1Y40_04869 [Mycobacterium talmoniae]